MSSLYDLSLNELVPLSIKNDSEVQNSIAVLDDEFELIKDTLDGLYIYSAIDTLPMDIIQLLAWQFNITDKNSGWLLATSEQEKRNLVKNAIILHKTKGTKYSVLKAIESLNLEGTVQEWFEYDGTPHHFKVIIDSIGIPYTENDILNLENYVRYYKNARSYLDEIIVQATIETANIYIGSITENAEIIKLELQV